MTHLPSLLSQPHLDDLRALAESSPDGALVEVGVYLGGSARILYEVAQRQHRSLYLYDTFTGHPDTDPDPEYDDIAVHPAGRFAEAQLTLDQLREDMPLATFCIGRFPDTLIDMGPIAFVHADCDLYHPTKAILQYLGPQIVPGGRILFDDYPWEPCRGVKTAVHQFATTPIEIRDSGKAMVTF